MAAPARWSWRAAPDTMRLGRAARRALGAAGAGLVLFLLLATGAPAAAAPGGKKRSFGFRVRSRDRDLQEPKFRRSLLRNTTMPLHGAVKDYGCVPLVLKARLAGARGAQLGHALALILSPHPCLQLFLCHSLPGHARKEVCGDCGYGQHNDLCALLQLRKRLRPQPCGTGRCCIQPTGTQQTAARLHWEHWKLRFAAYRSLQPIRLHTPAGPCRPLPLPRSSPVPAQSATVGRRGAAVLRSSARTSAAMRSRAAAAVSCWRMCWRCTMVGKPPSIQQCVPSVLGQATRPLECRSGCHAATCRLAGCLLIVFFAPTVASNKWLVLLCVAGQPGAPIIFGCETRETGEIYKQRADGLFGLGNSDASVVNQLVKAGVIDDVFSLCFGMVEGDGALLLGDAGARALPVGECAVPTLHVARWGLTVVSDRACWLTAGRKYVKTVTIQCPISCILQTLPDLLGNALSCRCAWQHRAAVHAACAKCDAPLLL